MYVDGRDVKVTLVRGQVLGGGETSFYRFTVQACQWCHDGRPVGRPGLLVLKESRHGRTFETVLDAEVVPQLRRAVLAFDQADASGALHRLVEVA